MSAASIPAPENIEQDSGIGHKSGMAALALGALGVVFGDIGTSPLYTVQTIFTADNYAVGVRQAEVYGVISLIFWSITMIVSVKYVTFIMRADDRGEGGIMALTGLLHSAKLKKTAVMVALVMLGIVGASLFYGDAMITPAISVLSAVSGLDVATPSISSLVLPITMVVLTALFAIQRFGTGLVGVLFGPVMLVWFATLALVGGIEVVHHPDILRALLPSYGARFILNHGGVGFVALASVVLAVTGAEALYADMGHFGPSPIRRAWFFLVFPALTLNYLGQGSLVLRDPGGVHGTNWNPFFLLVPAWAQIPMVILATLATVIASQAVISGAFSLTQQAVQLGFLPRLTIRHTSAREVGQIYVPIVNASMFVTVLAICIAFGSASALASAYGVAVTGTFVLNALLFLAIARLLWHKSWWLIGLGAVVFLTIDITFFAANLTKVVHGGWLPLVIAAGFFTILVTWNKGLRTVIANRAVLQGSLADFLEELGARQFPVLQMPGTSVFLNQNLQATPLALRSNVEHNNFLHDRVIIVSVKIERVPHVPGSHRVVDETRIMFSGATGDPLNLASDISALTLRFGYQDEPDVPAALRLASEEGLIEGAVNLERATYFLSDATIVATHAPGMAAWRKKLFVAIARNAADPARYFRLPDNHTITLGSRIQL